MSELSGTTVPGDGPERRNVSHELRTPLTLILGLTRRLMKSTPLTDSQLADLRTIYRNGNELLDLVNNLER